MTRIPVLLMMIALVFMSVQAALAASVTIIPAAAGTYILQGDGMDGVAGIDLTLIYDSSSLSGPTVSQGSLVAGALMGVNTSNPGSIKIAIISTRVFSGSGQIATVNFATRNGTGGITSAFVNMINSQGAPITSQVVVPGGGTATATPPGFTTTPGVPFSQPGTAATGTSSVSAAVASSVTTTLGVVSVPADVQPKIDTKPADTPRVPERTAEPATAAPVVPSDEVKTAAESQKPDRVKMTSYKGVLDIFRAYSGEKTPSIFTALFNREITPAIRQEPSASLSDGNTALNILVKFETSVDTAPNFSLNGATLLSLNRDASLAWTIEALPRAGSVQATLTILTDSEIIEYPLTVAPPVEGISPAEEDFAVFLTDSGAAKPRRDLNGDGRHDYLDDFIYTANYLKKQSARGTTKRPEPTLATTRPSPPPAPSPEGSVRENKSVLSTLLTLETVNRSKIEPFAHKLASSGFQPVVREISKSVDVYRLITGCFSVKAAAQKSLNALARKEKNAFMVHDADQYCVAAVSLFSYDAALGEQDRLAKKAVKAEIVKSQAAMTAWQIIVGRYNEETSMAADVNRLKMLGINAIAIPLN
jgi:hypothetical protein